MPSALGAKMHHAGEGMILDGARPQHLAARFGDLVIVLHRAAADADRANQLAILEDRQSAGEGDQALIGELDAVERISGLGQLPELARRAW